MASVLVTGLPVASYCIWRLLFKYIRKFEASIPITTFEPVDVLTQHETEWVVPKSIDGVCKASTTPSNTNALPP